MISIFDKFNKKELAELIMGRARNIQVENVPSLERKE